MSDNINCPKCEFEYTYELNGLWNCPDCGNEWNPDDQEISDEATIIIIRDANGNVLQDGDSVVVIKDLPVKGMPKPIKAGTKVKSIRLKDGDHNIDCKIAGFGAMSLKSEFVKKA